MNRPVLRRPEPSPLATGPARATAGRARRLVGAVLVGVGTGAAVVVLALLVRQQWPPLARFDQRAVAAGTSLAASHPALLHTLTVWQWLFLPAHLLPLVLAGCLLYWWRTRQTTRSWWAVVTILAAWGLSNVVKELVRRARPVLEAPVESASGFSFPSGHAVNTAAMTTALVVLLWPVLRTRGRRAAAVAAAAVLTALTAADRVALGVHYPTDVVAGVLFGAGFVLASYLAFRHWPAPSTDRSAAS